MVNINFEIPEDLHKQLKLASLMQDKSLKDYIIETIENKVGEK